MNKLTTILLALPMLFMACSGDTVTSEPGDVGTSSSAIRFHSSLQGMTRSSYKSDLSNLVSFKVAGLTNVTTPEVYFTPMEVTHEADGSWKNTITYYWPTTPLKFYAFAPIDLPINITGYQQTLGNFTVASKPADQKDIITAWGSGTRVTPPAINGPVSLTFHHALAQVEIRASNPSDTKVDVLGVKICRIPSTGNMTMQQRVDDYATWQIIPGSEKDYVIKGDKTATGDQGIVTMQNSTEVHNIMFGNEGWLMLPQQLSPWTAGALADGAYISVLCQIHDGSGRLLFPDEEGKYGFTSVPIDTKWEAGHRYVYTLNFFANGGSAGLLDPNPGSPDDPTGEDEDIDTTPGGPGRQGGDIVVNSPITFTVDITDWMNTTTDNTDIGF